MTDFEKSGTLNSEPSSGSKTNAKSEKKTKGRNSVTALAQMFDKKPSEREKKITPIENLQKIKNEAISQEELPDIDSDSDSEDDEIKNRKKASTFSQKLNMFNRNAPDSIRQIKKDLEKKDFRIFYYDKVLEEKRTNKDWIPTSDYEGQLTSRRKIVDEIEQETNSEIINIDYTEPAEEENLEKINNSLKIVEIEAEGIDDVFDDIYIAKMEKKEEESKPIRIDIPAKKAEQLKNINFQYKQLDTSNDISLNQEKVINISNLNINQNNYNPIFNSYMTDERKENEMEASNDNTKDDQQVFGKNSRKLIWNGILRFKYFYLAVLIIILIVMLVTFFIY